jgi:hypothetical protein
VPYWVGQSPSQGMFPKENLSRPCNEYEVGGGQVLPGIGSLTYKGSYCLIYGCLYRGCVAPSFAIQLFSKPLSFNFIAV